MILVSNHIQINEWWKSKQRKKIQSIYVILDDFTDENGTLQIRDTKVYPKAGDIIGIHGDTPHQSEPNKSDKPRCD